MNQRAKWRIANSWLRAYDMRRDSYGELFAATCACSDTYNAHDDLRVLWCSAGISPWWVTL